MKLSLIATAFGLSLMAMGCGSTATTNVNANVSTTNVNAAVKLDPANMPDGLKPEAIQPSGAATPGIPANVTNLPKGATPTPGIPDPATIKKGMKPGATPTPGIPSPEELRKMMGQPAGNVNKPAQSDQMMMKNNTNKIQKPQ